MLLCWTNASITTACLYLKIMQQWIRNIYMLGEYNELVYCDCMNKIMRKMVINVIKSCLYQEYLPIKMTWWSNITILSISRDFQQVYKCMYIYIAIHLYMYFLFLHKHYHVILNHVVVKKFRLWLCQMTIILLQICFRFSFIVKFVWFSLKT